LNSAENKHFGFLTSRDISEARSVGIKFRRRRKVSARIQHLFAICAEMEKIYRLFLLGEERERK